MKKTLMVLCLLVSLLVVAACSTSQPAPGPAPAPGKVSPSPSAATPKPASSPAAGGVSFAGKTITMVVPFAAGGSADLLARLYALHFPRFLPGKPSIVVRNLPGGGGTIGANYAYSAKPDGLTAVLAGGSVLQADLMKVSAAKFELNKMAIVLSTSTGNVYYARTGIIDKAENLLNAKGLIFGAYPGGSGWIFVSAKELLKLPIDKMIMAYTGSADSRRALLAGEINMAGSAIPAYKEGLVQFVDKGELMLLFQSGLLDAKGNLVKDPAAPPIIHVEELYKVLYGKSPSGVEWDVYRGVIAGATNYDKMWVLPPGTPEPIARVYWEGAEKMIKDPEFLKGAGVMVGAEAKWLAGEALDKEFKLNFGMDRKLVDWLKGTLGKYGVAVE